MIRRHMSAVSDNSHARFHVAELANWLSNAESETGQKVVRFIGIGSWGRLGDADRKRLVGAQSVW
jgi:hypothetical protein